MEEFGPGDGQRPPTSDVGTRSRVVRASKRYLSALVVPTLLVLLWFGVRGVLLELPSFFALHGGGDARFYWRMSHDPFEFIRAPFSYRILVPAVAYLSPLDNLTDFRIINVGSLYVLLLVLYEFLRSLEFSHRMAALGTSLYVPLLSTLYTINNIVLVDFPAHALLLLSLLGIVEENVHLFGIPLLVGVLVKEVVLFSIPVFVVYALVRSGRPFGSRAVGVAALYVAGSVLVALGVRIALAGSPLQQTDASMLTHLQYHARNAETELVNTAALFNFMYLAPVYWRRFPPFLKVLFVVMLPISVLQLLLARDAFRMLAIDFVAFIPASLYLLAHARTWLASRTRRVDAVHSMPVDVPYYLTWGAALAVILGSNLLATLVV